MRTLSVLYDSMFCIKCSTSTQSMSARMVDHMLLFNMYVSVAICHAIPHAAVLSTYMFLSKRLVSEDVIPCCPGSSIALTGGTTSITHSPVEAWQEECGALQAIYDSDMQVAGDHSVSVFLPLPQVSAIDLLMPANIPESYQPCLQGTSSQCLLATECSICSQHPSYWTPCSDSSHAASKCHRIDYNNLAL